MIIKVSLLLVTLTINHLYGMDLTKEDWVHVAPMAPTLQEQLKALTVVTTATSASSGIDTVESLTKQNDVLHNWVSEITQISKNNTLLLEQQQTTINEQNQLIKQYQNSLCTNDHYIESLQKDLLDNNQKIAEVEKRIETIKIKKSLYKTSSNISNAERLILLKKVKELEEENLDLNSRLNAIKIY